MQANRIADVAQRQPRVLRPLKALAPRLAGGSFGIDRSLNAEHGDTFRQ
jgi:hypothetical protein